MGRTAVWSAPKGQLFFMFLDRSRALLCTIDLFRTRGFFSAISIYNARGGPELCMYVHHALHIGCCACACILLFISQSDSVFHFFLQVVDFISCLKTKIPWKSVGWRVAQKKKRWFPYLVGGGKGVPAVIKRPCGKSKHVWSVAPQRNAPAQTPERNAIPNEEPIPLDPPASAAAGTPVSHPPLGCG